MTDSKILDRVRALLELAHSDNANEAANAMGQAQRLMARHGIGEAMLAADDAPEPMGEIADDLLHSEGKATWRVMLASSIATANQCQIFLRKPTIRIVGYPKNRDTTRYLFTYAASEIDRLCKRALSERGNPGRVWANNFRLGAVDAIRNSLREAGEKAREEMRREADAGDTLGNGAALVRVNTAIASIDANAMQVKHWVYRNLNLRRGAASSYRSDPSARAEGYRAGQQVNLSRGAAGALGAGSKSLRG